MASISNNTVNNSSICIGDLGEGAFGNVKLYKEPDGLLVAIKAIENTPLRTTMLEREEQALTKLIEIDHPNIIKLLRVEKTEKETRFVTEYLPNAQDLYAVLVDNGKPLSAAQIVCILGQIVEALKACHNSANIIHRDLKIENVLYNRYTGLVKLIDFGSSKKLADGNLTFTVTGTPGNMAPEVLAGKEGYGKKSEIWTLGILLYGLGTFFHPFEHNNHVSTVRNIMAGNYVIHHREDHDPNTCIGDDPQCIDADLKDLIRKLLQVNPDNRIPLDQIMDHPYCQKALLAVAEEEEMKTRFEITDLSDTESEVSLSSFVDFIPPMRVQSTPIELQEKNLILRSDSAPILNQNSTFAK